jgi:hypothetical protein
VFVEQQRSFIIESTEVEADALPTSTARNYAQITERSRILALIHDFKAARNGTMVCASKKRSVPVALGAVSVRQDGRMQWAVSAEPQEAPPPELDDGKATVWFTHHQGIYGFSAAAIPRSEWRFQVPEKMVRYSRRDGPRYDAVGSGMAVRLPLTDGLWLKAESVIDVSTGGICLDVDDRFTWAKNALTQVEIKINRGESFAAIAVVRHRRPGPACTRRYGLQFVDLDPIPRLAIERLTLTLTLTLAPLRQAPQSA